MIFLLFLLPNLTTGQDISFDKDKETCETNRGVPCKFPFFYRGHMHYECSTFGPGSGGTLFGRCPTVLVNQTTREPSLKREDWARCGRYCPLQQYTPNSVINRMLRQVADDNPEMVRLMKVGDSHLGQEILGVTISAAVQNRSILRPMVRYVGNMHGNEPVGRELLVNLVQVLVKGYNQEPRIRQLLDTTNITIIPTINPDGFDRSTEGACSGGDYATGRYNEGNKDLNRDFPTWQEVGRNLQEISEGRQPETKDMMKLILSEPWVLSANFHGGAVVASYPYDDYRKIGQKGLHKTEDHLFFKHLASTYANNHLSMLDQTKCTRWYFTDGITNGAEWYPLVGGMQDFNYLFSNDMEITLEVSCCKYPKKYYLNNLWDENRESLFAYLEQVHRGIKGLVVLQSGETVPGATVEVENMETGELTRPVSSSQFGEYWKLLLPGTYRVRAILDECSQNGTIKYSSWQQITLTEEEKLQRLDLVMDEDICQNGPR